MRNSILTSRSFLLGLVLILAISATVWAISGTGRAQLRGTGDAAAWIQAVWSVAAIIVAIVFPGWEAEVRENAEYRRQRHLLGQIVGSAEKLLRAAADCGNDQGRASTFGADTPVAPWAAVRDSLANFPVTDLRTAEEVQHLMVLRAVMSECTALLVRAHDGRLAWHGMTARIASLLERSGDSFRELQRSL